MSFERAGFVVLRIPASRLPIWFADHAHRLRQKNARAAQTSAIEQRLQQGQVIRRSGIDAASARKDLGPGRLFQGLRQRLSVRIPHVQAGLARAVCQ
jgi:hypothetical protein